MSLVTIAAPAPGLSPRQALPAARPERFLRSDFIAAAFVFAITLGVYLVTLAPCVTLEDSGELITAATKFGVPHPPGYPLFTLCGFILSHLLPIGNLAWRINCEAALFGGAANAVMTLLVCHSGRWLMQRWVAPEAQAVTRRFAFYAGMMAGVALGFSDVMWSQAVITAVHGTLNALFVNLVLLFFYFWMLEPHKTHRLIIAVFILALGLTNHHTLIQMIPAMLLAALILNEGKFWSVFLAINLFSLSVLVYLSWLSVDPELYLTSARMACGIFVLTALVSFFYQRKFQLLPFLGGAALACTFFLYGHYFFPSTEADTARVAPSLHVAIWHWGSLAHPGWLQFETGYGVIMLLLAAGAVGLLFTSILDRRLVIGVFCAGWVGLTPYGYERLASSTNPPMNWGFASARNGFYYAVTREQYPLSLPNLIKDQIGKRIGAVPRGENKDVALGRPSYYKHLGLTFYYYADNLQANFTVPLIFLSLVLLLYLWRADLRQFDWIIFLGGAFFFLAFMLHIISPPESFDFQNNLQYRVFHLLSHCIFAIFLGYGALAAMTYLHELMPEIAGRHGAAALGFPALGLALLPLWNNFDNCNQADHWFGYDFGYRVMQPMEPNAVYLGGSDFGRFVPTYMAFVESQQSDRWKHDSSFDRRDVAVITQNALCDVYYTQYIRNQYDPRFRPAQYTPFEKWLGRDTAYPVKPVICMSDDELNDCWREYEHRPDVVKRIHEVGGQLLRPGTTDVFDLNGIVAKRLFEKNKQDHVFYLEQSTAMDWTYPYMIPSGLIFKLSPEPLSALPPGAVAADRKYWDDLAAKLLPDYRFRVDDDATSTFARLAYWHADLYRYRGLKAEQQYWLELAHKLCPQLADAVNQLAMVYCHEDRYDDAIALTQQAMVDDPRSELFPATLELVRRLKSFSEREKALNKDLATSPYDVPKNLQYAELLQEEGKDDELYARLRTAAGLTNWSQEAEGEVVRYYVDQVQQPEAAIAFLEARAKIDPKASQLIYNLAALHASLHHTNEALAYLAQAAAAPGGSNALVSARIDERFEPLHGDPGFEAVLQGATPTNAAPMTNAVPVTNLPPAKPAVPGPAHPAR